MDRKFRALANRIDFNMEEKKVSAEAIGRAAGHADGSFIRRVRKGQKGAIVVKLATADAVALCLGLPRDYLFVEVDPRTGKDLVMPGHSESPGSERVAS